MAPTFPFFYLLWIRKTKTPNATIIPIFAWVLSELSVYFIRIIIRDYNAIRQRPIIIDKGMLILNIGIRWYAEIPISEIKRIEFRRSELNKENSANFLSLGSLNIHVHLNSENLAKGIYGITKKFTSFSIFIDEKQNFKKEIDEQKQNTPDA